MCELIALRLTRRGAPYPDFDVGSCASRTHSSPGDAIR